MEKNNRKILFIINPRSGLKIRGLKIRQEIERIASKNKKDIEIVETLFRGQGTEWAKKALKEHFSTVVAVGGDGTINDVASALVGQDIDFGVIPAGSGNGFARNYGIPLQPEKALDLIFNYEQSRKIDVGVANHHYFFNVLGIGFDAVIAEEFEKLGVRGPLPYFWAGFKTFLRYSPQQIELVENGEGILYQPFLLCFANGKQFGNGAIIAPYAQENDGLLNMVMITSLKWYQALIHLPKLFNGAIHTVPFVTEKTVQSAEVHANQPIRAHVDGEIFPGSNLIKISVKKQALNIISSKKE